MSSESQTSTPPETEDRVVVRRRPGPSGDDADSSAEETSAAASQSTDPSPEDETSNEAVDAPESEPPKATETSTPVAPEDTSSSAEVAAPSAPEERVLDGSSEEDFALLLAAQPPLAEHRPGDRIIGTLVSIGNDIALVDIGSKAEALLERRELEDEDGKLLYQVGQHIEAQVIGSGRDGVRLSTRALKANQLGEMLEEAAKNKIPVEGRVVGFNKGGLEVRLGSRRGFCPASQVDLSFTEDLSVHLEKTYTFVITRYDPSGRKLTVSRRAFLEAESKSKAVATREALEMGAILEGTVRKIMPFGAFVDLGGIDGLIHVSELSWGRVEDPKEVVSEGQTVQVKVLKIDSGRDRVSLSLRQAGDDPWATVVERLECGSTVTGTVTRLADFGAFVALEEGIEGLVHNSEIDWTRRIRHPKEVLEVGQEVQVAIVSVDPKKKRVALSIRQLGEDPWASLPPEVQEGATLKVTVQEVANFGVFANVAPGITGLIPTAMLEVPRGGNAKRIFKIGKAIEVSVVSMDKRQRKITLASASRAAGGSGADFAAYKKAQKKASAEGPSALALALMAAQEKASND